MSKNRLSLPHERRKAQLKAAVLDSRVKIAAHRERIDRARTELQAMKPNRKKEEIV